MSKIGKVGKRKKTGGRTKGTPNKISISIKQAVLDTFAALGGVEAMTRWAKKHPSEFYKIASRLIPQELTGRDGGPIVADLKVSQDPRELARRLLFLLSDAAAKSIKA